ncbi:hypothetical protein AVEN_29188-1 [Araneus ventricosus]|uniref:Reverse transcriptase domain-containing protein n=1 Tax=Araneus ventricosus TaxID=182803 RepID=A0A4Y2ALT8_ARAVE|nr:hypothetical protein AVEN_29188-1 [Araneus ventricosus]
MPETGHLTRSMDKQFEKLFAMMAEMKAGQEEMKAGQEQMRVAQAGLEQTMEFGQEEMRSGQEKMRSGQERLEKELRYGQEEMKTQIQAHIGSQVEEIKIHVDGCIRKIEDGSQWFMTLDLKSRYWQVEVRPEDRQKTAFTTGQGLWQFKVMPFGLCNVQQHLKD